MLQISRLRLGGFAVAGAIAVVAACSSDDSGGGTATLATDAHAICVVPSTSAQDVALPATGGITGTLSFGAFPGGATGGCDEVRIATGASVEDLTTASVTPGFLKIRTDPPAAARPILTVSVGEAIDSNPLFGAQSIVTGMVLNTGSNVNFPDGNYYMTVTRVTNGQETRVDTILLTATNGVLKVAPISVPTDVSASGQFPVIIIANTASILSVYPRGVVPPSVATPTDPDAPPQHVDVSDAGLPPLPTDPPEHAPAQEGFEGLPPPNSGTIGYSEAVWTDGCSGNPGCDLVHPIDYIGLRLDAPAGMNGTIVYETNLAYMQLKSVTLEGCPADWDVNAGLDGNGTIGIPASTPLISVNCIIHYFTYPPSGGNGYGVDLTVRPLDIGDH